MEEEKSLGARLGEGCFCIVYLVATLVMIIILKNKYFEALDSFNTVETYRFGFGFMMAILLVGGDAFHLIPRIIVNFRGDMYKRDQFLGLGTLLSSITMTLFYNVLISMVDSMEYHGVKYNLYVELAILVLTVIRIVILLLPGNKWFTREAPGKMAYIRNIPFIMIGLLVVYGLINVMINAKNYPMAFYLIIMISVILSFAFYIPVAFWGKEKPKVGVLMLPKTVCYMVLIAVVTFWPVQNIAAEHSAVIEGMDVDGYKQISQTEAKRIMDEETGYIILDVRSEEEFADGHIPNAICLPNGQIPDIEKVDGSGEPDKYGDVANMDKVSEVLPDKNQMILVYCRSGRRSKEASKKLADMGYMNVYEFGGIIDWTGKKTKE